MGQKRSVLGRCLVLRYPVGGGLGVEPITLLSGFWTVFDVGAAPRVRALPRGFSGFPGGVPGGCPVEVVRVLNVPLRIEVVIVLVDLVPVVEGKVPLPVTGLPSDVLAVAAHGGAPVLVSMGK